MSSKINVSGGWKSRKTRTNLEKTDADNWMPWELTWYWARRSYPFYISRMWKDEVPEDDSDSEDNSSDEARGNSQASVTVEEEDPGFVWIRGQVERERLKDNMP